MLLLMVNDGANYSFDNGTLIVNHYGGPMANNGFKRQLIVDNDER